MSAQHATAKIGVLVILSTRGFSDAAVSCNIEGSMRGVQLPNCCVDACKLRGLLCLGAAGTLVSRLPL